MSSLDDSYLLHDFLFHLRTPLYGIKGAFQLAKQLNDKMPAPLLNWLEKWKPSVERWISAEEKAHDFLRDDEEHDWKQIIYELAKDMQGVQVALAEGQSLEIPESPECEMIVTLTLKSGFNYLSETIQPILNQNFQH